MNRQQRRSQLNSNPQPAPKTVNIRYGHNDEVVAIIFPEPVKTLTLSEEQTDAMIAALQDTKAKLIEHKRKLAAGEPVGAANG